MKSSRRTHSLVAVRPAAEQANPTCEQALRVCEAAAARLKTAGEELAASWSTLCHQIANATVGSSTDLLRKRAWCNVLELRLKEHAHALEQARQGVDAVWDDLVIPAHARELFGRLLKTNAAAAGADRATLPLVASPSSYSAGSRRLSAKK